MSLKKGDLVEVLGCLNPKFESFVGKRFILEDKAIITLGFCKGSVGWGSPFWVGSARFTPMGTHLRKVNPDGDELSDESFDSLVTKLKSAKKDNNIVTVNIKLEEKKYNDYTK